MDFLKKSEVGFAAGMILLMSVLIVPIPSFIMDFFLSISITLSFLVFMSAIFVQKALEFNSFPTVLLVLTIFRLGLNVASTRLILTHGHEGTSAAGGVIEAFGHLVMAGNFLIGLVVFGILIIINFVVITKGSGRIAEVSARFSLDAMPGKQMAIDAELSSGAINEIQARSRRKQLEAESNFYGAMDGASKFVRGDAIAGLLITFINVIGGIIVGTAQMGLSFQEASKTYTILTVGDGLVAQIPALIISIAAGLIITKSGDEERTDQVVFRQLGSSYFPFMICSFLTFLMAILPGMPFFPFFVLSAGTGFWAYHLFQKKDTPSDSASDQVSSTHTQTSTPPQTPQQTFDQIRLELGVDLVPLVQRLGEQLRYLKNQFLKDLGVHLPTVRIVDQIQLNPKSYHIIMKDIPISKGEVRPKQLLAMNSQNGPIPLDGEAVKEPTFGLDAMWITPTLKSEAEKLHLTVVDPATVIMTHLSEILKDNVQEFITFSYVQNLLDELNESYKRLLNEIVPGQLSVTQVQKILQSLVIERVSIRDINSILEGIAEGCAYTRSLHAITEYVRSKLSRQITMANVHTNGVLNVLTLSAHDEEKISESLIGEADQRQLALSPTLVHEFMTKILKEVDRFTLLGYPPVLVTNALNRPYVRSLIERVRPSLTVMSQNEIHPKVEVKNLGIIQ